MREGTNMVGQHGNGLDVLGVCAWVLKQAGCEGRRCIGSCTVHGSMGNSTAARLHGVTFVVQPTRFRQTYKIWLGSMSCPQSCPAAHLFYSALVSSCSPPFLMPCMCSVWSTSSLLCSAHQLSHMLFCPPAFAHALFQPLHHSSCPSG